MLLVLGLDLPVRCLLLVPCQPGCLRLDIAPMECLSSQVDMTDSPHQVSSLLRRDQQGRANPKTALTVARDSPKRAVRRLASSRNRYTPPPTGTEETIFPQLPKCRQPVQSSHSPYCVAYYARQPGLEPGTDALTVRCSAD